MNICEFIDFIIHFLLMIFLVPHMIKNNEIKINSSVNPMRNNDLVIGTIFVLTSKSIISLGWGASGFSPVSNIGIPSFLISFSRYRSFLSISSQRRTSLTNFLWKTLTSGLSYEKGIKWIGTRQPGIIQLTSLNCTKPSSPSSETQA